MSELTPPVNVSDHHINKAGTSIVLVEFGDYECPHCARAHPLVKQLLKENEGSVDFVFRHFPLQEVHPNAFIAAMTAEAAGKQGQFWQMHDLIFENQDRLSSKLLLSFAETLGLDMTVFSRDVRHHLTQKKIDMDFESGLRSGVNGTPTFYINGIQLLTYSGTYTSLQDALRG